MRLRLGGAPQEQDEERANNLLQCWEAIMEYERALLNPMVMSDGRNAARNTGNPTPGQSDIE